MAGDAEEEAAGSKRRRLRISRKAAFVIAGGLFLFTASAAAAYVMGGMRFFAGDGSAVYGLDCTLVDSVSFKQGDERWARDYVAVSESRGLDRVRTALRVARHAAATGHADLVLVVVLDRNGPRDRAGMRDEAVGAQILYAPHPARVATVGSDLSGRYVKAEATDAGMFYGDTASLPLAELDRIAAAMKKPYGCNAPDGAKPVHAAAKKTVG